MGGWLVYLPQEGFQGPYRTKQEAMTTHGIQRCSRGAYPGLWVAEGLSDRRVLGKGRDFVNAGWEVPQN
jgi:hypothetical protein